MPADNTDLPKVVIDGSNMATEGRTMPSLAQLVDAVTDFNREFPGYEVIVVVDATFGHRIDESEKDEYDEAASHGELISPPAGAIGRGDAFLLRIADKTGAMILSNDSFQEFHGEFEWLFEKGRLLGGTPVPGVGWIFTPRSPVRGPKSREAVKEARRSKAGTKPAKAAQAKKSPRPSRAKAKEPVRKAIEDATEEAENPSGDSGGGRGRNRRGGRRGPSEPVNEPMPFINFVQAHPPGTEVEGTVEQFSSHGAFVLVDDLRCYIPLSAMADPAPRAAREVMKKDETRTFVIQAFDPPRRGIELALPGFAHVSGTPTEETVDAEIAEAPKGRGRRKGSSVTAKKNTDAPGSTEAVPHQTRPKIGDSRPARAANVEELTTADPGPGVKGTLGKKATKTQKAAAKKVAKKTAKTAKKSAAEKAPAKKAVAKKSTAKKSTAKKSTAKKAPVKKAPVKKAPVKRDPVKKSAAKKAVAKKTTAKKTTAKKSAAKKPPAKRR